MKRLVLFAILLFFAAAPSRAQEASNPRNDAPIIDPSQSPAQAVLSARQKEEMQAEILMARKDYAEAVKAYSALLKNDPKNARDLNQLGIAYQELGEVAAAERSYRRAARDDKKFASPMNNLGSLEYARKRYGRAVKYYRKALAIPDADLAVIYSNLGYAYFGESQREPAMAAFSKALAIDPDIFARRGGSGSIVQQRSSADQGALYFLVAKSYAKAGDAEHAAHYLKVARDDGYKNFASAKTDPDFASVIKDRRVQEVFDIQPVFSSDEKKL